MHDHTQQQTQHILHYCTPTLQVHTIHPHPAVHRARCQANDAAILQSITCMCRAAHVRLHTISVCSAPTCTLANQSSQHSTRVG